ncbi:MAG: hypothetical protein N2V73_06710 [Candidatus Methanospirare jalkutatii]|nr:hypothetical protein [Candidatus Methanospirare jalkutatii]
MDYFRDYLLKDYLKNYLEDLERWCRSLGISKEECMRIKLRELDHLANELKSYFKDYFKEDPSYGELVSTLAEITVKFGEEGIKATFSHIALDRIAELRKIGLGKEKIKEKLIGDGLIWYIPDYDCVFEDIAKEVKPNEKIIEWRKEWKKVAERSRGVRGFFYIDGEKFLAGSPSPVPALLHVYSRVKKGETVCVKWEYRRGIITRFIRSERDFEDFLSLIKRISKEIE